MKIARKCKLGACVTRQKLFVAFQIFQEGIQEAGVCLAFVETLQRETIVSDAKRAALTIKASTAKVILVIAWYTDAKELFVQLANINVRNKDTCGR